jgi:hypothetical protein
MSSMQHCPFTHSLIMATGTPTAGIVQEDIERTSGMLYKDINRKWKVSRWSGAGAAAVAVQVMGEKGWWVEGCQGREIRKGAHCRPHTNSLLQFPFLIPSSSQHDTLLPLCLWVFLQLFLFITPWSVCTYLSILEFTSSLIFHIWI